MKAVLMSIQPKWCELIASCKKTVEVRKTKPKLETPFKVYIYETQGRTETPFVDEEGHEIFKGRGQVIGEFVCDMIADCRDIRGVEFCINSQMSLKQWRDYTDGHKGVVWAWHISDLVIYDEPKELMEFATICEGLKPNQCDKCGYYYYENTEDGAYDECCCNNLKPLERPPQSWCYVEERSEV
jgi:predicted transcriptional regulator